jgi:hypothetical protein
VTNEWPEGDSDNDAAEAEEFGPGSADYDLSEEHGYRWEQERGRVIPQGVMVAVSIIVVVALVLPTILLIYWYG